MRKVRVGALLIAGACLASLLVALTAAADVKVKVHATYTKVTYKWFIPAPGGSSGTEDYYGPVANFDAPTRIISQASGYSHVIMSGGVDALGVPHSYGIGVLGATAGNSGLGTSAVSDSAFARDTLNARVTRPTGTSVHLDFLAPTKLNGNTRGGLKPVGAIFVAIYPDSIFANADVNNTGAGAVANGFGKVTLGEGTQGQLIVSGTFFSPSDFTVNRNADGTYTVLPIANLNKTVTVPNSNTAVVSLTTDPNGTIPGAPGVSSVGLVALILLLLASGVWFLRRRDLSNWA